MQPTYGFRLLCKGEYRRGTVPVLKPLKTTTARKGHFQSSKKLFGSNDILLQAIGSICTDGSPTMLGNRSGFVFLMKNEIPGVAATHCILHYQALVSKTFLLI